jgi:hypothetical protein
VSNLVVHFEIHATEPQTLIDFYSELLGWRFTKFGDTAYWAIDTGEGSIRQPGQSGNGINGGLAERRGPRPEPGAPVNCSRAPSPSGRPRRCRWRTCRGWAGSGICSTRTATCSG